MTKPLTELTSQRLALRQFNMQDLSAYFALVSNQQIARTAGFTPANDLMEAKFLLSHQVQLPTVFAIVKLAPEPIVIGSIGLYEKLTNQGEPDPDTRDLGYMLNQEYWHQGYMTEAVALILKFGFDTLHLEKIAASCLAENTASQRILDHFEFRYLTSVEHSLAAQFGPGSTEEFYCLTQTSYRARR